MAFLILFLGGLATGVLFEIGPAVAVWVAAVLSGLGSIWLFIGMVAKGVEVGIRSSHRR